MKCPVCVSTDLQMTDRQGVEIDYCPQCRGVWLDRGELDKILERSEQQQPYSPAPPQGYNPNQPQGYNANQPGYRRDDDDDDDDRYRNDPRRKKKGWLFDIFD